MSATMINFWWVFLETEQLADTLAPVTGYRNFVLWRFHWKWCLNFRTNSNLALEIVWCFSVLKCTRKYFCLEVACSVGHFFTQTKQFDGRHKYYYSGAFYISCSCIYLIQLIFFFIGVICSVTKWHQFPRKLLFNSFLIFQLHLITYVVSLGKRMIKKRRTTSWPPPF